MSTRQSWTRTSPSVALALAASLALVGCGPDTEAIEALEAEVADLRVDLAERRTAEADLAARLDDLEAALADATGDDGLGDRVAEVDDELGRIVDALTVLEADLAAERAEREQLAEDVEVADRDLRSGLTDLRDDLDAVRGEVGLLGDQVDVLRERVDRAGG